MLSIKEPSVTTLSPEQATNLINSISENRKAARRIVAFLSKNPKSPTVKVNQSCAVGNISQDARIANKAIYKHGFMVACEKPSKPLRNQFNENTAQYLWSLYRLPLDSDLGVIDRGH